MTLADDDPPSIEHHPPYSPEFVAHLHAGCYPDDLTPALLALVRADPGGARMLDDYSLIQLELRSHVVGTLGTITDETGLSTP